MSVIQVERDYLIHILSSVIHNTQPQELTENIDFYKLYKLSAYHSVSNMVYYGLNKESKPLSDVMGKFQSDCKKAIAKEATQHIVMEEIIKTFEENHIMCMPLKGYLIKYLYPKPDMRMMADVDILFKDEQTAEVKKLMLGMGFTLKHQGGTHDVYYRKPFMNIEMHRSLMPESYHYNNYFNKVWDKAKLKAGFKFLYVLSQEDFFIYIIGHLEKHYVDSGTGIRSIMDIWLYNNRYGNKMNWNYIQTELKHIGLWEFSKSICSLSQIWFGSARNSKLYDEMKSFIFSSGVYGIEKHSILSAMNLATEEKKSIKVAMFMYRFKLFFPKLKHMKILYPFLGNLPLLLPACWIIRGVKSFSLKSKHTLKKISTTYSLSEKDVLRIHNSHKEAGL